MIVGGTKLAFASCGRAGNVTIAKEETPEKLTVVQTLETARGSRTMTLDPRTHRIYLAAGDYVQSSATQPVGTPTGKFVRPQTVPDERYHREWMS